jgi:hypothetical protein
MSVVLALLVAATPNPYLAQAKVLHQGLEFEKCLKRLEQASRWDSTAQELAEIELYSGLCQFGLGNDREAAEHFQMGLKVDAKLALPPLVGPKVTALFQKAQAKVLPALRDVPEPEKPAPPKPEPPPPEPPPKKVELMPAPQPAPVLVEPVPEPKPRRSLVFVPALAIGAAIAAGAGVTGFLALDGQNQANAATYESDGLSIGAQARTLALTTNVLWAVAGAALIVAVVMFFAVR